MAKASLSITRRVLNDDRIIAWTVNNGLRSKYDSVNVDMAYTVVDIHYRVSWSEIGEPDAENVIVRPYRIECEDNRLYVYCSSHGIEERRAHVSGVTGMHPNSSDRICITGYSPDHIDIRPSFVPCFDIILGPETWTT